MQNDWRTASPALIPVLPGEDGLAVEHVKPVLDGTSLLCTAAHEFRYGGIIYKVVAKSMWRQLKIRDLGRFRDIRPCAKWRGIHDYCCFSESAVCKRLISHYLLTPSGIT